MKISHFNYIMRESLQLHKNDVSGVKSISEHIES